MAHSVPANRAGTGAGTGLSSLNPHVKFNWNRRGYVRTVTTPTQMAADFRAVNQVTVRGIAATTVQSYVIEAGNPGLQTV